jgi:hypothetical protein
VTRYRKLENVGNFSVILVALIATAILVDRYFIPHERGNRRVALTRGELLHLPGVTRNGHEHTLVIAMQAGCQFCTESGEFYKRLAGNTGRGSAPVLAVAVLPNSSSESHQYLEKLGLDIQSVSDVSLSRIHVKATPTIVLIDRVGRVENIWVGKLSTKGENQIIDIIRTLGH